VWPLLIAGTESVGLPEDQGWVEAKMIEVMQSSGFLDRQRVLIFLKAFWGLSEERARAHGGSEGEGSPGSSSLAPPPQLSWVEVAREWAASGNSFLVL